MFIPFGKHSLTNREFEVEDEPRPRVADRSEVKAAIWRMKTTKAPGKDGITAGILRKCWPILGDRITSLFNDVLTTSTFLESWKTAELILIPKGTDRDLAEAKSFRPVSLLPVIAKAIETVIITRLHDEIGNIMSERQHGFIKGKSTNMALDRLYDWVDNSPSRFVIGTFLDITGAFYNLSWDMLFEDLEAIGASNHTMALIRSYLVGRRANLTLEGERHTSILWKGCPQGS